MDAATSIGAIPKLGRFGLIIHFILIYSLSLCSFNKFSLRISSKISITAFFYFAGLLRKTFCLVFVLESFSIRGNFNVMLRWVTKSISCKKSYFYKKENSWKEVQFVCFAFGSRNEKMLYNVLIRNISWVIRDHVIVGNFITKVKFMVRIRHIQIYFIKDS